MLPDRFPLMEERRVFVQYVHLPPAVYLPWMWAITAHYGDNYLSNSPYFWEMATCVHHGKMDLWKAKTAHIWCINSHFWESTCASAFLTSSPWCVHGVLLLSHVTLCIQPPGLLLLHSSETLNGVRHKKEVVGVELLLSVHLNIVGWFCI